MNQKLKSNDSHNLFRIKSTEELSKLLSTGTDINMLTSSGQNALFHCKYPELMKAMINAGININQTDTLDRNALFYAFNPDVTRHLIQRGINVNHRDMYNNNAVNINYISTDLLNVFFAAGLDPDIQDYYGNSLIFYSNTKAITDILINNGCDINHVNNNGETVFEYIQTMLFSNSQLDERLSALTHYLHLITARPLIFSRLTFGCLEMIKTLQRRNIGYKISERCVVRYPNKDIKNFITEAQKIIDISDITLCSWYDTPLVSLKNKEIIKWFIRNNIKVNVNDIEEQNIRTDVLSYIASREKKEIRQLFDTPEISGAIKRRL
ncbi:Ankyrin repeats (3 copies) [Citrobacter freundii]|nr:Ankyrin repeats (3 copies) [Citrobacter freundii]